MNYELPEKISDFKPMMSEIVTRCVPYSEFRNIDNPPDIANVEILYIIDCDDGWVVVYQLPSKYWQGGCP